MIRFANPILPAALGFALLLPTLALAQQTEPKPQHAVALLGTPALPRNFTHFPYANLNAPKNGSLNLVTLGSFDSLNSFSVRGNPAQLLSLTFDTLMTPSLDEPSSQYPLVAQSILVSNNPPSVTFQLNPNAAFSDGNPITSHDVAFSLNALKNAHPHFRSYYADALRVETPSPHVARFILKNRPNRELPYILSELPVLPSHFWKNRSLSQPTLDISPSSGPYVVSSLKTGNSITFTRNPSYWGSRIPSNRGRWNFQSVKLTYLRDSNALFEAFKAGHADFRAENIARNWAEGYDFPAAQRGEIVRETVPDLSPQPMQGYVLNLRRPIFQNPNTRRAFNLAFNFQWANKTLFHNSYVRTNSYFQRSDLAAVGLPSNDELALLNPLKNLVPTEVFTTHFTNPDNSTSHNIRQNLRKASQLLRDDGWILRDGSLYHPTLRRSLNPEILLVSPSMERITLPYVQALQKLGAQPSVRILDPSQYRARINDFDFDVIVHSFPQSLSPGNEQRDFWSSKTALVRGSANLIGVNSPAVDALVEHIIQAQTRPQLVAAARALDRVLLHNHFLVPHWHVPYSRIAYRRKLQRPNPLPAYGIGLLQLWWTQEP